MLDIDINDKLISGLSNQLQNFLVPSQSESSMAATEASAEEPMLTEGLPEAASLEEKERVFEKVKESADKMKEELMEIVKQEYQKKI